MRAWQIFAGMSPEQVQAWCRRLADESPPAFAQALAAAAALLKARPVYVRKLPFERRAELVRRALARVAANDLAEEILASYFLDCRRELLEEWLDAVGVEHEDGMLKSDAPAAPAKRKLDAAVKRFRAGGGDTDSSDRELLLRTFAAQRAIEWPDLDALLA